MKYLTILNIIQNNKMVATSARRIKLSKNLRPFVSRVNRAGAVQIAFTEQIGHSVGGCVRSGVHAGLSGAEIHDIARKCAQPTTGTLLDVQGARSRMKGRRRAPAAARREFFEVA